MADWYPEKRVALQAALKARIPFTTGWYSSKKEIASACITGNADAVTPVIDIEVRVSDDFDTPGKGSLQVRWTENLVTVANGIYAAWDEAERDQKENRVHTGFKVLTRKKVHSTFHGGRPVGKARLSTVWSETYIRNDSNGLTKPPGDYYPNWGWQGDCKIPKAIRDKLERYAESYRKGKRKKLTVGKWTIEPWEVES